MVCGDLMRYGLLFVAMSLICTGMACAQDAPTVSPDYPNARAEQHSKADVTADQQPIATDDSAADPSRTVERRKKALAGLAALCGIAITGVAAIAVTIVWARRLRRLARDPGPAQKTAGNDFWFLKPPKQTVEKSSLDQRQPPLNPSSETDRSQ